MDTIIFPDDIPSSLREAIMSKCKNINLIENMIKLYTDFVYITHGAVATGTNHLSYMCRDIDIDILEKEFWKIPFSVFKEDAEGMGWTVTYGVSDGYITVRVFTVHSHIVSTGDGRFCIPCCRGG